MDIYDPIAEALGLTPILQEELVIPEEAGRSVWGGKLGISPTNKGQPGPNRGITFSSEWRENLSKAHIGCVASTETRAKMSATRKGRKHSPEHIEKIRAAKIGRDSKLREQSSQTSKAMTGE